MDWNTFLSDERGVPPVIGVILMVAVVTLLAAVVGSYVFGIGVFNVEPVPQAQFSFEYNESATSTTGCSDGGIDAGNGELTIRHNGGDSIDVDTLSIRGAEPSAQSFAGCSDVSSGEQVKNRDEAYVEASSDDVVRLVWAASEEENSQTLAKWNGTAET